MAACSAALGVFGYPRGASAGECILGGELTSGCYRDGHGAVRDPAAVYRQRLGRQHPVHLRTLAEEALVLGIGATWYWLDRERNLADWDFPSWKQRFTLEAWRFDNNHFPINFFAHPLNGAAFYVLPRLNDQSLAASTAYAFATSFAWEFLIEFREKVSINDLVVTLGAGIAIGEFANKLWRYFDGVSPEAPAAQRAASRALALPYWLHREADGKRGGGAPYDGRGFSTEIGQQLYGGYLVRLHDYGEQVTTHGFSVGGRLSSIPGEGRPGRFGLFFHEADVVSLSISGAVGAQARELEVLSDTHLLGWYAQDLGAGGEGHAATLGLSLAYRYRFQDFERYNDRLGLLHLPGPGADYALRWGAARLSTSWRLSADFAGLHAPAYGAWAAERVGAGDRPKSILRKHNYHYGWGISSRLGARLKLPYFDLSAEAFLADYASQQGLDRAQEELTLDPEAQDRLFELATELGFRVPKTPVRLGVGWSSRRRWSRVEDFEVKRSLSSWSARVEARL